MEDGPLSDWIIKNMPKKSVVGADGSLLNYRSYEALNKKFKKYDIDLSIDKPNLVDLIWDDRPSIFFILN